MHPFNSLLNRTQQLTESLRQLGTEAGRMCAELAGKVVPHDPANDVAPLSERSRSGYSASLRTALWRAAGLRLGRGANILGALHIRGDRPWREFFSVGADTVVAGPLYVQLGAPVQIGEGVHIAEDVSLQTIDDRGLSSEIHIGDGSSLGAGCSVMPGVSIGAGAVVAPGALVTEDVPPNSVVAGAPARVVPASDVGPQSGVVVRDQANAETSRSPLLRAAS